jgi:hypothetical protein
VTAAEIQPDLEAAGTRICEWTVEMQLARGLTYLRDRIRQAQ